jgi:NhaP-type Na+/H+ or K+/H+ antiporter/mannitol/fructose-specific phosphotransferase system IIA component (Ntr-type)
MDSAHKQAVIITLTAAIGLGLLLTILARRLRVPGIVLLLAGGVAFGPEGLNLIRPESMLDFLPIIVSLAVGIILFEGGLTLDLRGYMAGSTVILRLLSLGVIVTWLGTATAVHFFLHTEWALALLAASLVIVTGPTVIGPLLKRLQVDWRVHGILHWEGVLIDPIGVFIATMCFEWFAGRNGEAAVYHFALRTFAGLSIGAFGGFAIVAALRWKWIPDKLFNAFALAAAVFIFGMTEAVISEAGLLAVTLAGFIVGWRRPAELKEIQQFKAEITDLLIGMLFLLLTARLKLEQFHEFGWAGAAVVAVMMLVVRPLSVVVSTVGSPLRWRERVFLGWVAPRGIVAASLASLFSIELAGQKIQGNPLLLQTLTFSVIIGTVVVQGFTAGGLARLLRLRRPEQAGWLIVNADRFGRGLAQFIRDTAGLETVLLDTNARRVIEARAEGHAALMENALNPDLVESHAVLQRMGHLVALTDNKELNELLCQRWAESLGRESVFRWSDARAAVNDAAAPPAHGRIAFPRLASPSVVAAELLDEESSLQHVEVGDEPPLIEGSVLLLSRAGQLLPNVEGEPLPALQKGDHVLYLKRGGGFLARSVFAGEVIDLAPHSLADLYTQLLDLLIARHPKISREKMLAHLHATGSEVPAWIGHGVAIPHGYSANLAQRLCFVARLNPPLPLPELEDSLRLVFLLVSPAGDPDGHLGTLAEIARFCSEPRHLRALLDAPDAAAARAHLLERAGEVTAG